MIRISGGTGFWLDVGFNYDGDDMIAEYVPCDINGRCLPIHKKRSVIVSTCQAMGRRCVSIDNCTRTLCYEAKSLRPMKYITVISRK